MHNLHVDANPNMAKSGPLNCVIGPEAGKWSYITCFLCISGRYNVYVACEFLLWVQGMVYMVNWSSDKWAERWWQGIPHPVRGRKANWLHLILCLKVYLLLTCSTATPTDVIVDLGDAWGLRIWGLWGWTWCITLLICPYSCLVYSTIFL